MYNPRRCPSIKDPLRRNPATLWLKRSDFFYNIQKTIFNLFSLRDLPITNSRSNLSQNYNISISWYDNQTMQHSQTKNSRPGFNPPYKESLRLLFGGGTYVLVYLWRRWIRTADYFGNICFSREYRNRIGSICGHPNCRTHHRLLVSVITRGRIRRQSTRKKLMATTICKENNRLCNGEENLPTLRRIVVVLWNDGRFIHKVIPCFNLRIPVPVQS